jgi:hypothetical protein
MSEKFEKSHNYATNHIGMFISSIVEDEVIKELNAKIKLLATKNL